MKRTSEDLDDSLARLAEAEPLTGPAVRRALELRLMRNPRQETPEDNIQIPEFETDDERAEYVLAVLRETVDKMAEIWKEFRIDRDPDDVMPKLEEAVELRSMVDAYLTLPDDDKELLGEQDDEILQQKIAFADAVIELWIRDEVETFYREAQEKKIRHILGGRAIRLTPITPESMKEWLDDGCPADELFCEGHIASVYAMNDGYVSVSMAGNADGSGPVTGDIYVWRRNNRTGEVVQEVKIEVLELGANQG